MAWGTDPWGIGPWGAGSPWGTNGTTPAPTLIGSTPAAIDELGGDVVTIVGTHFVDPILVEFLQGGNVIGASTVPGSTYVDAIPEGVHRGTLFDATYDIAASRAFVGSPALPAGVYDLRVTTAGGQSNILAGAVVSQPVAMEQRVVAMRSKWSRAWQVGARSGRRT